MNSPEKNQFQSELLKIGDKSLFLIDHLQKSTGKKGEAWQTAVEINKIAHALYKNIPNTDAIKEEKGWEDYYNNPYLR
jgi:hypothetical protein